MERRWKQPPPVSFDLWKKRSAQVARKSRKTGGRGAIAGAWGGGGGVRVCLDAASAGKQKGKDGKALRF